MAESISTKNRPTKKGRRTQKLVCIAVSMFSLLLESCSHDSGCQSVADWAYKAPTLTLIDHAPDNMGDDTENYLDLTVESEGQQTVQYWRKGDSLNVCPTQANEKRFAITNEDESSPRVSRTIFATK